MKKFIYKYSKILALFFIAFWVSSCDPDIDPTDAAFYYYVSGNEDTKNPSIVYVGQTIVFRTDDISGGETMVVWTGDEGHDYEDDTEVSGDTVLRDDFQYGYALAKTANDKGTEVYYMTTHQYKTPSGSEGYNIYMIAGADDEGVIEYSTSVKQVIVKDTTLTFEAFSLWYPDPRGTGTRTTPAEVEGTISNDSIYCRIPYGIDVTEVPASFDVNNSSVFVNDILQIDHNEDEDNETTNDYTNPVKFVVKAIDSDDTKTFTVVRLYSTDSTKSLGTESVYFEDNFQGESEYALTKTLDNTTLTIDIPEFTDELVIQIGSQKGNIFMQGEDIVKTYGATTWEVELADTADTTVSVKVYAKNASSTDYTVIYNKIPRAINSFTVSEAPFTEATVSGNDLTFKLDPNLVEGLDSVLTPVFELDKFSYLHYIDTEYDPSSAGVIAIDSIDSDGDKVYDTYDLMLVSGKCSFDFGEPVELMRSSQPDVKLTDLTPPPGTDTLTITVTTY